MAFDLRRALLKKAENESARLMDFEFRQRARTFRLLAEQLGLPADELVAMTAHADDEAIFAQLAEGRDATDLRRQFDDCRRAARTALIRERGDPSPHRLL
jgi:hypothetical protein